MSILLALPALGAGADDGLLRQSATPPGQATLTVQTPAPLAPGMRDISAVTDLPRAKPREGVTTKPFVFAPSTCAPVGRSDRPTSRACVPAYRPVGAYAAAPRATRQSAAETTRLIEIDSRPMGDGPVLSGLDVMAAGGFAQLKGKRVGLLVNHSSITRDGTHIIDHLRRHPEIKLVKMFSPEHGLFGDVDTQVADFVETRTGLMVHSLYSPRKEPGVKPSHPRPGDLKGLDVVVVDMQDIGARFYTYPAFMAYMMEECGKLGIEVIVLDRPNPLGGVYVDGTGPDADLIGSPTNYFDMPVAHGMTMGELAKMFNAGNKLGCRLTVVPMKNWQRAMLWDQTGLRWVNPSPNIRDMDAVLAYPGIGMTERIVSMGRGTTEPFHLFGAPWIWNAKGLCEEINSSGIAGVRLEPVTFKPEGKYARGHVGEKKTCKGARIVITDRAAFRPVELGIRVMSLLQRDCGRFVVDGPFLGDSSITTRLGEQPQLTFRDLLVRIVGVRRGSASDGSDTSVVLDIRTPKTSRERTIQAYRSEFVDDYEIAVLDCKPGDNPVQGSARLQITYNPQDTQTTGVPLYDIMRVRASAGAVLCAKIREETTDKAKLANTLEFVRKQADAFSEKRKPFLLYRE